MKTETEKTPLQNMFPNHKLLTLKGCLVHLGWSYIDNGEGATNIRCCDEKVKIGGWVGAEHAACQKCEKGMQDVTGILPDKTSLGGLAATHINWDNVQEPKDGRIWIPVRTWG